MKQSEPAAWPKSWTHTVGREVSRLRKSMDMSAETLGRLCGEYGHPLPRNAIMNLEHGRKEALPVHELVVLASALLVSPIDLLFPLQDENGEAYDEDGEPLTLEYLPNDHMPRTKARDIFTGSTHTGSVLLVQARLAAEEAVKHLRDMEREAGVSHG